MKTSTLQAGALAEELASHKFVSSPVVATENLKSQTEISFLEEFMNGISC